MLESETAAREMYAGFWIRVWAALVDIVLLCVIVYPPLISSYGWEYFESDALVKGPLDFLLSWVLPAIVIITFWILKSATPGKMAVGARIVDARTGGRPSNAQFVGRYFAYFVSGIVLALGIVWVGFDSRKQGWHDKLAGTVVVRRQRHSSGVATFDGPA